jgi:hypothetical protein
MRRKRNGYAKYAKDCSKTPTPSTTTAKEHFRNYHENVPRMKTKLA